MTTHGSTGTENYPTDTNDDPSGSIGTKDDPTGPEDDPTELIELILSYATTTELPTFIDSFITFSTCSIIFFVNPNLTYKTFCFEVISRPNCFLLMKVTHQKLILFLCSSDKYKTYAGHNDLTVPNKETKHKVKRK